jgi:ADP-ribose pyrophosphatase YjhB (NUDIX family)
MPYCFRCGQPLRPSVPPGDSRERLVCDACGYIHYENPRLIVGVLPDDPRRGVLLCRRAIEPRLGLWTLPAGFLENGEEMTSGARRETLEEAGARLGRLHLYTLIDIPHIHQVHVFYRARILSLGPPEGTETLEVRFFVDDALPWDELAFRSVRYTLERYVADRARRRFPLHETTLLPLGPAPASGPPAGEFVA